MPKAQNISKRQALREKRLREQRRNRILSIVGITALAVLIVGVMVVPSLLPVEYVTPPAFERPSPDFNAIGNPDAPIKITEYSDYRCPHCRDFWEQTEEQLVNNFVASGKVYFVYRSMGAFMGDDSQTTAEASYCASDQEKFWEYRDFLFANSTGSVNDFTKKKLQAFAKALGLDMDAFNACLDGGKHTDTVTQDGADGQKAGIEATPSFVISYVVNGETKTNIIQGAQPLSAFQAAIEAALAEIGK